MEAELGSAERTESIDREVQVNYDCDLSGKCLVYFFFFFFSYFFNVQ